MERAERLGSRGRVRGAQRPAEIALEDGGAEATARSAEAGRVQSLGARTVLSPALGGIVIGQEVGRGLNVRAIFAEDGEQAFRSLETDALTNALADGVPAVIATGGGVVLAAANRIALRESSARVVWLCADPSTLLERVRPSIRSGHRSRSPRTLHGTFLQPDAEGVPHMADRVALLVGTRKGAFIAESDAARTDWTVRGPYLQGQSVMHMAHDPRDGALLAGRARDRRELEEEAEAVARQEPSHGGAKRPKILYATQGATPPPTVVLFARNADQVHFTWQRYLENQLRERYPLQGTPVRIVVRERAAEEGRERGRSGGRRR